ncbi:MAG: pectate lyase [Candidatus Omnitrophota bacterium]
MRSQPSIKLLMRFLGIAFIFLLCSVSWAAEEADRVQRAQESLDKALTFMKTLQRNGGWAMAWTADQSITYGESRIQPAEIIVVQPPATPSIGSLYLRAYEIAQATEYLETALAAGDALLAGQNKWGGFPHEYLPGQSRNMRGTYDDGVTQGATRFFVDLWQKTKEDRFADGAKRCGKFMVDSQYENGGWPQAAPAAAGYSRYITLNDGAMMDVIRALFILYHTFDDKRFYDAALRGADCLLSLQGKPPQAVWAQQYTVEGDPAPARKFEPAAYSASESMGVLRVLLEVYKETGDKKYLQAGPPAFAWYKQSRLPNGKWARLYELRSNRPIYSTEDRKVIYEVEKARKGYGWQGGYFDSSVEELYAKLLAAPEEKRMELMPAKSLSSAEKLWPKAEIAIISLDEQGRWLSDLNGSREDFYLEAGGKDKEMMQIDSKIFVRNASALLDFLQASKQP